MHQYNVITTELESNQSEHILRIVSASEALNHQTHSTVITILFSSVLRISCMGIEPNLPQ